MKFGTFETAVHKASENVRPNKKNPMVLRDMRLYEYLIKILDKLDQAKNATFLSIERPHSSHVRGINSAVINTGGLAPGKLKQPPNYCAINPWEKNIKTSRLTR